MFQRTRGRLQCTQRIEHPARGSAIDRVGRTFHSLTRMPHLAGDFQCQRCTEEQAIPVRSAILTGKHGFQRTRVVLGIASCQTGCRARR